MSTPTLAPKGLWQCGVDRFLFGCKLSEVATFAQCIEEGRFTARVYPLDRLPRYTQQTLARYFPPSWRNSFEKASERRQALMRHAMSYLLLKCEEMSITPVEATLANRAIHMHGFRIETTVNTAYTLSRDIQQGACLSEAYLAQDGAAPGVVELQVGPDSIWLLELNALTVYAQGNGHSVAVYDEPVAQRSSRSASFRWRKDDFEGIIAPMRLKLIPLRGLPLLAQAFTVGRIWLSDTEAATMTPTEKNDAHAAGISQPTIEAHSGNRHKADIFVDHIRYWAQQSASTK